MQNIHERYASCKVSNPDHVLCKNYEQYTIPSRLESIANSLFDHHMDTKIVKLWNNYVKADSELSDEHFNFVIDRSDILNGIIEKVDGNYLLTSEEVSEVITLQVKKNTVSYMVDFFPYVQKLAMHYGFKMNDFYNDYVIKNTVVLNKLGWSDSDYEHYSKLSPTDCYMSAKHRLLDNAYDRYSESFGVTPINMWHTLLDNDFEFVNSGSVATIDKEQTGDVEFDLFKRIVFKELQPVVGNTPVTFFVEW